MIDPKRLKELVKLMVDNDLTELDLQDQGERVTLKRGRAEAPQVHYVTGPSPAPPAAGAAAVQTRSGQPATGQPAEAPPDDGLLAITSPMVGTFYSAASPEAAPFADVGSQVNPDSVVCIIEAMKVFNEIKAEVAGTIAKVLVESGQAVEFGQPLFLVKK